MADSSLSPEKSRQLDIYNKKHCLIVRVFSVVKHKTQCFRVKQAAPPDKVRIVIRISEYACEKYREDR